VSSFGLKKGAPEKRTELKDRESILNDEKRYVVWCNDSCLQSGDYLKKIGGVLDDSARLGGEARSNRGQYY